MKVCSRCHKEKDDEDFSLEIKKKELNIPIVYLVKDKLIEKPILRIDMIEGLKLENNLQRGF